MSIPGKIVSQLLGETDLGDDEMLRYMAKVARDYTIKYLSPGTLISHGTGRSEDIAEAQLGTLASINRPAYNKILSDYSEEIEALNRIKDGGEDEDDQRMVDEFAYETLDRIINKFCLPYTYVGSEEGGSAYGCWVSHEGLKYAVEDGEVTKFAAGSDEARQFSEGNLKVSTPHVWIEDTTRFVDSLWEGPTHRIIWQY
jgi:hypothetical protein